MRLLCPQKGRKEGRTDGGERGWGAAAPESHFLEARGELGPGGPGAQRPARTRPRAPGPPSRPRPLTPQVTGNAGPAVRSARRTRPSRGPRTRHPGRPDPVPRPTAPRARPGAGSARPRGAIVRRGRRSRPRGGSPGAPRAPVLPARGPGTYFQGELLLRPLAEDLQNFPVDAQPQHLRGDLVVVDDGVLLDLQARLDVELRELLRGRRRRRLGRGGGLRRRRRGGERHRRRLALRVGQHGAGRRGRRGGRAPGRPLLRLRLRTGSPPPPARRRSLLRAGAGFPGRARLQARRVAGLRGSRRAPLAPAGPAPTLPPGARRSAERGTAGGPAGGKRPRDKLPCPGARGRVTGSSTSGAGP